MFCDWEQYQKLGAELCLSLLMGQVHQGYTFCTCVCVFYLDGEMQKDVLLKLQSKRCLHFHVILKVQKIRLRLKQEGNYRLQVTRSNAKWLVKVSELGVLRRDRADVIRTDGQIWTLMGESMSVSSETWLLPTRTMQRSSCARQRIQFYNATAFADAPQ